MKKLMFLLVFVFLNSQIFSQNVYFYPIPSGTTSDLTFLYSIGNANYYISGVNGLLLKSTNSGLSEWNPVALGITNNLSGFLLKNNITSSTHFVFGSSGVLIGTTNSGQNWASQVSNTTAQLNAGTAVTGDSVLNYKYLIVGNSGTIIYKLIVPGTGNWIPVTGITTANLKTVYSIGKTVWAGGSNGTMLKSINAGINWTQQVTGISAEINSILFKSETLGFAVCNGGIILKTTNGGTNWTQLNSGTVQNLNQIVSISQYDLTFFWVMGNAGVVLRTSNAGQSWLNDPFAPNVNFSSGLFVNNYLYVVANQGKIYKRSLDTSFHSQDPSSLDGNNIRSFFTYSGIFDIDTRSQNYPGFEWPKDSGKFAIFSAGLTLAGKVNGVLRMASASYKGEYYPGYCNNGVFYTDGRFKIYKYTKGFDTPSSWDWIHWSDMVPFGAPFIDVNNNGSFEYLIDTPGVRYAKQTLFICLTDASDSTHNGGEGFGGGTQPMGAELHLTAWVYDSPDYLRNVQFLSYDIINKSTIAWDNLSTGIVSDLDLGSADDDFIGCDTNLQLGFCYNGDNSDPVYGANPPAVGMTLLRSPLNRNVTPNIRLKMTSFSHFSCTSCTPPPCESTPTGEPYGAYLMLSGYKKDSTCWLNPMYNPPKKTKFCYPGDPETNIGWNEVQGSIWNCNKDSTGAVHAPNPSGDRRYIIGSGANNFRMMPGESNKFVIAQLIARGTSNLNSVTRLKQLTDSVRTFYETNFPIGIRKVADIIPEKFNLFQNYPNPFNPVTN
ncbi:MAG: hypothetical protein HY959_13820, partial [Ignavibacteriae bacterium]|nr:hypothetical protein [Ignavibacteriota bacterium]